MSIIRYSVYLSMMVSVLACNGEKVDKVQAGVSYQTLADSLHIVLASDRKAYEDLIFDRLGRVERVLRPHTNWKEEKTLPFPSQFFAEASQMTEEMGAKFSYVLISKYPLNKQNKPITEEEKRALDFVYSNPKKNYYGEEVIGKQTYFTAAYAETAYARPCVTCHNNHDKASKFDYSTGHVIGAIFLRIPMES